VAGLAAIGPEAERHLERDLDAGRSRIREEDRLSRAGMIPIRPGPGLGRLMRPAGEDDLVELAACSAIAAMMRGWQWPWVVTHQDEMASTMRRPSACEERGALGMGDERDRLVRPCWVKGCQIGDPVTGSLQVELGGEGGGQRARVERRRDAAGGRAASPADPGDGRLAVGSTASPMKAMPRIGTPRARSASIDNRLWLIVPSVVRATSTTGRPQRANRSANSRSRVIGTSTPPAPSTTSGHRHRAAPAARVDRHAVDLGRAMRRAGRGQPIGLGQDVHGRQPAQPRDGRRRRCLHPARLDRLPVSQPARPAPGERGGEHRLADIGVGAGDDEGARWLAARSPNHCIARLETDQIEARAEGLRKCSPSITAKFGRRGSCGQSVARCAFDHGRRDIGHQSTRHPRVRSINARPSSPVPQPISRIRCTRR
jgi:hypothetical protein